MKFQKTIISIGAVAGAILTIVAFWAQLGWILKPAYAQDHEGINDHDTLIEIQKLLGAIQAENIAIRREQTTYNNQWECDELDEEIPELNTIKKEAKTNEELSEAEHDVDKANDRWNALKCSEFYD